jgi:5'-3' exonuclease
MPADAAPGRLMLLDAASLYFRAFFGVPTSVVGPHGRPVNAIRGYLDYLAFLIPERSPERLVSCLDLDWRPAFRVAALPSYKAHRLAADGGEEVPAELVWQVPILLEVLDALGLCQVGAAGFEADDVVATLAEHERGGSGGVDIVTGDRDLFQLVDDESAVRVLYTAKGVRRYQEMDAAAVQDRYGVPPHRYAAMAALRGDPSDGLPGVPGVGEKTAAELVNRFGSIPDLVAALDTDQPVPRRRALQESRGYLDAAMSVVEVRRDVPLADLDDGIPRQPAHPDRLADLVAQHGLESSVARVTTATAAQSGTTDE